jgi:ubiquinone biosynthesis protein
MEEGVATALDPDINMWETAEPFLKDWIRTELGPEAYLADRIIDTVRAFKLIPDLIKRIDAAYPKPGGAPPPPPLAEVTVIERKNWMAPLLIGLASAAAGAAAVWILG